MSLSFFSDDKKHTVFLCFRGKDTRQGFVSHLYKALVDSKMDSFRDDKLPKGRSLSELLDKIDKSMIAIAVFSETFAASTWCLDELVKIMECKESPMQVLPVFYKVHPSELRQRTGKTGKYMAKHAEKYGESSSKILEWRLALEKLADLKGWHHTNGDESQLVSEIVEEVRGLHRQYNTRARLRATCNMLITRLPAIIYPSSFGRMICGRTIW